MKSRKVNEFYYINKIFFFYGFESNIMGKLFKTFLSIVTILSFILHIIGWTFVIIFESVTLRDISWIIRLIITLFSFIIYRRKHKKLFETIKKLSFKSYDKNIKKLSFISTILWLILTLLLLTNSMLWVLKNVESDIKSGEKSLTYRQLLKIIFSFIIGISNSLFGFGLNLMQILVYLQTNYIIYCIKRKHYNNLINFNFRNSFTDLKIIRINEIEIQSIEEKLNDLIGFAPIVLLSFIFIILCITITQIATTEQSIEISSLTSIDVIIIFFVLIIVITIVGQLNTKYDINTITIIVNKCFTTKQPLDQNFKLEMIQYLIESSNRCNNRPKSCGLYFINSNLILAFVNSVITFSVMCVQLRAQPNCSQQSILDINNLLNISRKIVP
jgi:hypothetical protein